METKPHQCSQQKGVLCSPFIFLVLSGGGYMQTEVLGERFLKSRLTTQMSPPLVIPSRRALCPGPHLYQPAPLTFFSTFIAVLRSLCVLVPLLVCMLTSPTGTVPPWRRRIYLPCSSLYPSVKDSASHRVGAQ